MLLEISRPNGCRILQPCAQCASGKRETEGAVITVSRSGKAQTVYTEYPDPRREEWETKIVPALRKLPIRVLVRLTNKSPSTLTRTLAGRNRPRRRNQILLKSVLRRIGML